MLVGSISKYSNWIRVYNLYTSDQLQEQEVELGKKLTHEAPGHPSTKEVHQGKRQVTSQIFIILFCSQFLQNHKSQRNKYASHQNSDLENSMKLMNTKVVIVDAPANSKGRATASQFKRDRKISMPNKGYGSTLNLRTISQPEELHLCNSISTLKYLQRLPNNFSSRVSFKKKVYCFFLILESKSRNSELHESSEFCS